MKRHVTYFYPINIALSCCRTDSTGYNIKNCPSHPTSLSCVISLPTHSGYPTALLPPLRCAFVIRTTQKYNKAANPNFMVQSSDSCHRARRLDRHLPTGKCVCVFDQASVTFRMKVLPNIFGVTEFGIGEYWSNWEGKLCHLHRMFQEFRLITVMAG